MATIKKNRVANAKTQNPLRWKHAYHQFFIFQLVHIGVFYLLKIGILDVPILFASGSLNIILYTRLFLSNIKHSGDDISPFWFYLAMSILRMGVAVLYVALLIWTGDTRAIILGRIDATALLMDGHLLLLIGDLCFIAGYFFISNRRSLNQPASKPRHGIIRNSYKAGLALTLCGLGLRMLQSIVSFGGLGQIIGYITDYGVPAGIFLMFDYCRRHKRHIAHPEMKIPIILLGFSVASGLNSYMKTDLLVSLFPLLFILIDSAFNRYSITKKYRKIRFQYALIIGLLCYFFLFTISSYSELRREGYRANMTSAHYTKITVDLAPEVLPDFIKSLQGSIPGTDAFSELQQYPRSGVWYMLNRLSVTSWAATSMKLVDMRGHRPDSMLGAILLSITPRVLFPDKPQIVWGREVAVALGQARSTEKARTSTGLTMFGFQYWWGGYLNVIIMSLLSGAGFAFVYKLFKRDWRINPVSALVIMSLTYHGFHWKESDVLGGFPYYIYMIIIFFPLSKFVSSNRRQKVRKHNPFKRDLSIRPPE